MGPRRLILLRHAQAQPEDAGTADFDRTLTERGAREAAEAGRYLVRAGFAPDLIVASPAARTQATAAIVAELLGIDRKLIEADRKLYQAGDERIWRRIGASAARVRCLLICAHNPGISLLASRLGPKPERHGLPTAGIAAAVWKHGDWSELRPETAEHLELFAPRHV
ncbi:MAG TPA: histidine phosphatase family protein [Steroidobacteraceae bacterium]|nr:histidine phosphatase family protein [Steroidobacteraceae bacterium]